MRNNSEERRSQIICGIIYNSVYWHFIKVDKQSEFRKNRISDSDSLLQGVYTNLTEISTFPNRYGWHWIRKMPTWRRCAGASLAKIGAVKYTDYTTE
jgi:hypothetical protein